MCVEQRTSVRRQLLTGQRLMDETALGNLELDSTAANAAGVSESKSSQREQLHPLINASFGSLTDRLNCQFIRY